MNLKEAAESSDDSDDLDDFIADFGEQCGIGNSERRDETCVTAVIPTPVRLGHVQCTKNPIYFLKLGFCLEILMFYVSALLHVRALLEGPGSEPAVSEGVRHGDPAEAAVHHQRVSSPHIRVSGRHRFDQTSNKSKY